MWKSLLLEVSSMFKEDGNGNQIHIRFSAKELQTLQNIYDRNQYLAIWVKKQLLEIPTVKQKFIELYGETVYSEALARASRSIVQIQEDKANLKLGKRKEKINTETLMVELETLKTEDKRKFWDFVNQNGLKDMDFDDLNDKMKAEWFLKWKGEKQQ
jgi:hypothetical protein